jgi:co-chaperonin GroES (HSP10)
MNEMESLPNRLFVVGDRVLIAPEEGEERTKVGLYLPATAVDTQQVQEGHIVATGPGDPVPDASAFDEEPWKAGDKTPRYRPMQARIGDHAIFSVRRRWRSTSKASATWWFRRRPFSF